MALPAIATSPAAAAQAYQSVNSSGSLTVTPSDSTTGAPDFGSVLGQALEGVVDSGHAADAQSAAAISGNGNITDVVAAVSKAELALQTTATIRDRVVSAYQEIMRMSI
jgi:flagellar hook-basal body complex protein FliE